jgi:polysaccharide pyruvyl transferase WcaK-like protein
MVIELRGVEFVNKGAELMLEAILAKVKENYPLAVFAMEISPRAPISKLRRRRILVKTNFKFKGIPFGKILDLIPKSIRNTIGFVSEEDISIVLDGSGFAFGDKWGARKAGKRCGNHIEKWKKEGKKIILLPQAFGPFSDRSMISMMKKIVGNADLIFARDRISFDYLNEINGKNDRFKLFPDFTNLVKGNVPKLKMDLGTCVAIIPNQKMMDTKDTAQNLAYPKFLKTMIEKIQKKGLSPFFLIHESEMDRIIALKINEQLEKPISIIEVEDPLEVKGIIGVSFAVITSRFHGLVSALSQSIPCLATGWSHKYEMLFEDYGYPEGLCQVIGNSEYFDEKLSLILEENKRGKLILNLSTKAKKQKELTQKMWDMVFTQFS